MGFKFFYKSKVLPYFKSVGEYALDAVYFICAFFIYFVITAPTAYSVSLFERVRTSVVRITKCVVRGTKHFFFFFIVTVPMCSRSFFKWVHITKFPKKFIKGCYALLWVTMFLMLTRLLYELIYDLFYAEDGGMVMLEIFFYYLVILVGILIAVAFFTLAERKIMAFMQLRRGPNYVGFSGLLQPLADAVKLLLKETITPMRSNRFLFIVAPISTFFLSLLGWSVLPLDDATVLADIDVGILFLFAISGLHVYSILLAGWSSNSKYAYFGALRTASQMLAYEVSIGLFFIVVALMTGSLNLCDIVEAQSYGVIYALPLLPVLILFIISVIAETNRSPFDLPEAESELVSGYNVEYSAVGFVLFFLAEYSSILLMSGLTVILFFGGWLAPFNFFIFEYLPPAFWFSLKLTVVSTLFIWVRATLPRYRYDQLMQLGWKVFLPLSLALVVFYSAIVILLFVY